MQSIHLHMNGLDREGNSHLRRWHLLARAASTAPPLRTVLLGRVCQIQMQRCRGLPDCWPNKTGTESNGLVHNKSPDAI